MQFIVCVKNVVLGCVLNKVLKMMLWLSSWPHWRSTESSWSTTSILRPKRSSRHWLQSLRGMQHMVISDDDETGDGGDSAHYRVHTLQFEVHKYLHQLNKCGLLKWWWENGGEGEGSEFLPISEVPLGGEIKRWCVGMWMNNSRLISWIQLHMHIYTYTHTPSSGLHKYNQWKYSLELVIPRPRGKMAGLISKAVLQLLRLCLVTWCLMLHPVLPTCHCCVWPGQPVSVVCGQANLSVLCGQATLSVLSVWPTCQCFMCGARPTCQCCVWGHTNLSVFCVWGQANLSVFCVWPGQPVSVVCGARPTCQCCVWSQTNMSVFCVRPGQPVSVVCVARPTCQCCVCG